MIGIPDVDRHEQLARLDRELREQARKDANRLLWGEDEDDE